jgi:hypothetical protein
MKKQTKIILDFPCSVERLSTTDIQIIVNGKPTIVQTHRLATFFDLIERCMIEERHKQGALFS